MTRSEGASYGGDWKYAVAFEQENTVCQRRQQPAWKQEGVMRRQLEPEENSIRFDSVLITHWQLDSKSPVPSRNTAAQREELEDGECLPRARISYHSEHTFAPRN